MSSSDGKHDADLIKALRTSKNMDTFSAAVFSHADLAKNRAIGGCDNRFRMFQHEAQTISQSRRRNRCMSEEYDSDIPRMTTDTTAQAAPQATSASTPLSRKRSLSSIVSLDSSHYEDTRIKYPTAGELRMLSFPMKLHWMLESCELSHRAKRTINNKNSAKISTKSNNITGSKNTVPPPSKKQKRSKEIRHKTNDIIIGWLPGGKSFKIYNEDRFVREIMPTYRLGMSNNSSCTTTNKPQGGSCFKDFQRDLKLWGFTDMPSLEGPPTRSCHVCSHPNFLRDQPSASRAMWLGGLLSKSSQEVEKNHFPKRSE